VIRYLPLMLLFKPAHKTYSCHPQTLLLSSINKPVKLTLLSKSLQNMEEREWFSRNFELMRIKSLSSQRRLQLATVMLKSQVCVFDRNVCVAVYVI